MPHWDLQCQTCGRVYDCHFEHAEKRDAYLAWVCCEDPCFGRLVVRPNVSAFNIKGYNATNHYGVKSE